MRPHGECDNAPCRFEWQGRIDLGHYLICRIAVLSVVDHGIGEDPCAAYDKCPRHDVGVALDVWTLTPIDHDLILGATVRQYSR